MYTVYRFISTSACDDLPALDLVKSRSEAFHISDLAHFKACNLRYSHKNISSLQPKLIPQCLHMYGDQIDYILALRICTAHPGALIFYCSFFPRFDLLSQACSASATITTINLEQLLMTIFQNETYQMSLSRAFHV